MRQNILLVKILFSLTVSTLAFSCHADTLPTLDATNAQHLLNRIGYGATQADLAKLKSLGIDGYLEQQLKNNQPLPTQLLQALDANDIATPQQLATQLIAIGQMTPNPANTDIGVLKNRQRQAMYKQQDEAVRNQRMLLAIYNPNQLQEVMTDFWYYHFNVFSTKSHITHMSYADFEKNAIRPYALGKFEDLLKATAHHPAMLDYLDNRLSSKVLENQQTPDATKKGGINENYAREIMELHTLGVNGGYTQADVTNLARIFTGWGTSIPSIAQGKSFVYSQRLHDSGEKTWLKTTIPAGQQMEEGEKALSVLAHSPATAKHIATKLAEYFVSDNPPAALVERLTQTFLQTEGDIAQIIRVIIHSPEFWQKENIQQKFKSPLRYVVSSIRNSELPQINPTILARQIADMGMPLYGSVTPDGYSWKQSVWLTPASLQKRLTYAARMGNGRLLQDPTMPNTRANDVINPTLLLNNAFANPDLKLMQRYNTLKDDMSKTTLLLGSPNYMYY